MRQWEMMLLIAVQVEKQQGYMIVYLTHDYQYGNNMEKGQTALQLNKSANIYPYLNPLGNGDILIDDHLSIY